MNDKSTPIHPLLTPVQAAARLGLSPKTLANWRSRGGGPRFVRLTTTSHGVVRYPVTELDEWWSARIVENTSTVATRP